MNNNAAAAPGGVVVTEAGASDYGLQWVGGLVEHAVRVRELDPTGTLQAALDVVAEWFAKEEADMRTIIRAVVPERHVQVSSKPSSAAEAFDTRDWLIDFA